MNALIRDMNRESDWQELVEKVYTVVENQVDPAFCHKVAGSLGLGPRFNVVYNLIHIVILTTNNVNGYIKNHMNVKILFVFRNGFDLV